MKIIPFDTIEYVSTAYQLVEQWKRYYMKYITHEKQKPNPIDTIDGSYVIIQEYAEQPIAFFYQDQSPNVTNVYLIIHPKHFHSIHDMIRILGHYTNHLIVRLDMYYLQSPEIMEQLQCYPIQTLWENENQRRFYIVSKQYHPYPCTHDATFSQSSTNETITTKCAIVTFTDTIHWEEIHFPDDNMHSYEEEDKDEEKTPLIHMKHGYIGVFFETPIIYTGHDTTFFLTINGIAYKPCLCSQQVRANCPIRKTYGCMYHVYNKEINISWHGVRNVLLYGLYVPTVISPLYRTLMTPFDSYEKEYLYHGHQKRHFLDYLLQFTSLSTTALHDEINRVMTFFSSEIVQMIHEYMGNDFYMYSVP